MGRPLSVRSKKTLARKLRRPQIIVEQSKDLPVAIKISLIKPKDRIITPVQKPTVVSYLKTVRFKSKNTVIAPPPRWRGIALCRWIRQKRALRKLQKENETNRKKRERAKFEEERLQDFIRWESLKPIKTEPVIEKPKSPIKFKPVSYTPPKEKKEVFKSTVKQERQSNWDTFSFKKKAKPAESPVYKSAKTPFYQPKVVEEVYKPAPVQKVQYKPPVVIEKPFYQPTVYEVTQKYERPKVKKKKYRETFYTDDVICTNKKCVKAYRNRKSKAVSVKKCNRKESISQRFVNCFYRVCCQFYCYLTCIVFITCIVISLI